MTSPPDVDWQAGPVTVSVPATSANLGPCFDALGLALALHDVVEARILPIGLAIEVSGTGQDAADAQEDHLVIRAMRACFAALGGQPPGIGIRCGNSIPQGYGLGSSAGAIVAGLLAARALAGPAAAAALPDDAILRLAAALEGHRDNVAACLAGGLTIAWESESGPRSARLSPLADLAPVLCVPQAPLATVAARQALPTVVPHADAAANSAHSALLIAALTAEPALLMDATSDYLHQRYRAGVLPGTTALIGALRASGVPAVVSGAGPSVLALTVTGLHPAPAIVESTAAECESGWRVLPLAVDRQGARLCPP